MDYKKENGAYYTPDYLAEYIVNEIFTNYAFDNQNIKILEPSCGDGVFIKSLLNTELIPQEIPLMIDVVEKNKEEIEKVRLHKLNRSTYDKVNLFTTDFLDFNSSGRKYDLIIGNPPFINKRVLSEKQILNSETTFLEHRLDPKNFKNIWMSFVLKSISMLKDNGILCFVLPSEFLQVNYSSELRSFLLKSFVEIKIYVFKELVFEKIEQDVIILFLSEKGKTNSVDYFQINDLDNVRKKLKLKPNTIFYNDQEKWSNYSLSNSDINFINNMKTKFEKVNKYCTATAGIVTAANNYFIVNKNRAVEYGLLDDSYPVIKKSSYLPKGIKFTNEQFNLLEEKGLPTQLLFFDKMDINEYQDGIRKYLNEGIEQEIHLRYKCKKRTQWYKIPFLEASEGIFFKRSNLIPKIIVNSAEVLNTDSGYRIIMKNGYMIQNLVFSFYNSFTLLMSELNGRYYGGGVLELTPNEFKNLPIPYCEVTEKEFNHLDNLFKNGYTTEEILEYTDEIILKRNFNLTNEEIKFLKEIRRKLNQRRIHKINRSL